MEPRAGPRWAGAASVALLAVWPSACGSSGVSGSPDSGFGGSGGSDFGGMGGFSASGGWPSGGSGGTGGTSASGGTGGTGATGGASGASGSGGAAGASSDASSDVSPDVSDAPLDSPSDASTGQRLIVSEGTANRIYVLDLAGNVLSNFPSPVSGPRGVAYDRTKHDGFFVMGTGDASSIHKLSWTGASLPSLALPTTVSNPSTLRGLDYYASSAGDQLVFVHQNPLSIDVVVAVAVADGTTQLESSFYKAGFLQGVWGVHVVGPASGGDVERWSSWNDGSLQRWIGSQGQAQVIPTGLGALRGVTRTPSGDFWVVAGTQLVHLDAAGGQLGTIPAPSSNPEDLSYVD